MRLTQMLLVLLASLLLSACSISPADINSTATGEVLTGIKAKATGGGAPFDGKVDNSSDLDDLVETAWGTGQLGLHRGHAPIETVLTRFLGITHDEMHVLMEQSKLNLAGICQRFGLNPENLVDSLTNSFEPYLIEAVETGVIAPSEFQQWKLKIREQFHKRVHWEG